MKKNILFFSRVFIHAGNGNENSRMRTLECVKNLINKNIISSINLMAISPHFKSVLPIILI